MGIPVEAIAGVVGEGIKGGERIADHVDEQRAALNAAGDAARQDIPDPVDAGAPSIVNVFSLLDRADALILAAGRNAGDVGFQQSAVSQASDLVRQAFSRTVSAAKEINDQIMRTV